MVFSLSFFFFQTESTSGNSGVTVKLFNNWCRWALTSWHRIWPQMPAWLPCCVLAHHNLCQYCHMATILGAIPAAVFLVGIFQFAIVLTAPYYIPDLKLWFFKGQLLWLLTIPARPCGHISMETMALIEASLAYFPGYQAGCCVPSSESLRPLGFHHHYMRGSIVCGRGGCSRDSRLWVQIPDFTHTCCVSLGNLLQSSVLQCLHI